MGKVREHIHSDTAAVAQWISRKLRNHDPMSAREAKGEKVAKVRDRQRVEHVEGSDTVEYVLRDGQVFVITVQEASSPQRERGKRAAAMHD